MVLNPQKCQFMTLRNENNLCNFSCDDTIIKKSFSEKIIGLTIDNNLDFSDHISNICKTANKKLDALFRVSANMNSDKCSLLINSFIKSHFGYCPLVWMLCNRKSIFKKNQQNTRTLFTFNEKLRTKLAMRSFLI